MGILREVTGHPVHNYADVVLVALVHKVHEVLRGAKAGGGGEVSGHLIAPGTVEGVFGHGQHFNVGIAQFFDVGD